MDWTSFSMNEIMSVDSKIKIIETVKCQRRNKKPLRKFSQTGTHLEDVVDIGPGLKTKQNKKLEIS